MGFAFVNAILRRHFHTTYGLSKNNTINTLHLFVVRRIDTGGDELSSSPKESVCKISQYLIL